MSDGGSGMQCEVSAQPEPMLREKCSQICRCATRAQRHSARPDPRSLLRRKYALSSGRNTEIAAGLGPSLATQAARYAAINAAQRATDRVAIAWLSRPGLQVGGRKVS
jgi:hypothetical protein